MSNPNAIMSHQSHEFSRDAKSVECLTMRVHLAKDNPNPDNAPYRAAIVWQKHIKSKNPIQLNRNATVTDKHSNFHKAKEKMDEKTIIRYTIDEIMQLRHSIYSLNPPQGLPKWFQEENQRPLNVSYRNSPRFMKTYQPRPMTAVSYPTYAQPPTVLRRSLHDLQIAHGRGDNGFVPIRMATSSGVRHHFHQMRVIPWPTPQREPVPYSFLPFIYMQFGSGHSPDNAL